LELGNPLEIVPLGDYRIAVTERPGDHLQRCAVGQKVNAKRLATVTGSPLPLQKMYLAFPLATFRSPQLKKKEEAAAGKKWGA
jgi:hypothetical protein